MSEKLENSSRRLPLFLAGGLAVLVFFLAGILGWRGVLPPNGILAMVALGMGGFVAVALKDKWKRIRWGGGEIEMKKGPPKPDEGATRQNQAKGPFSP